MNALIETEQKSINEIRKHVPSLESNMKEIVEEQENLAKFKNHASKAFVCVKKMEDRVAAKTKFLGSLKQQNVSDRITISVNLGPTSNDFTKNITSLGKIVLKKEPVEISFKSVLPAQILVTPFACYRSFESINVSLEKTIDIARTMIYGCTSISDNRIGICCNSQPSSSLILMNIECQVDTEKHLFFIRYNVL